MEYQYPEHYGVDDMHGVNGWEFEAIDKGIAQNLKEEKLSIKQLCAKIYHERIKGTRQTLPAIRTGQDRVEVYRAGDLAHVCVGRGKYEERSLRPSIYQGPLRDYWTVTMYGAVGGKV